MRPSSVFVLSLLIGLAAARTLRVSEGERQALHTSRVLADKGSTKVVLVHLNDNHARYEAASSTFGPCTAPAVCFGGFAKLATAVKQQRAAAAAVGADILVLHAGDQFTGTTWDVVYTAKGIQVAPQFLNKLGLDAFVLGNHEFDYTLEITAEFIGNLTAPVLSCNLNVPLELEGLVKPYVVKTLPVSGVKVGIVGLTTQETEQLEVAARNLTFRDPLEALPGCVAAARAEGADIIIALTHEGAEPDFDLAADPAARDVDIIVGGHSHTLFYGPAVPAGQPQTPGQPPDILVSPKTPESNPPGAPYPASIKNGDKTIPVVQALWGSRYLGVLETEWAAGGGLLSFSGAPVLLGGANSTNPVADDPETAALILSLKGPVEAFAKEYVGYTAVYLEGPQAQPGSPDGNLANPVRMKETNLGDLVCDALLGTFKNYTAALGGELKGVPVVCLFNGGGVRASVPVGNITQDSIVSIFPFGNWAVIKQVDSETLVTALENGLSQWSSVGPAGRFPQVDGMSYAFNHSLLAGERLLGAWLKDNEPLLEHSGPILLLTNDYVGLSGGDGYTMIAAAPTVEDTSTPLTDVMSKYIGQASPLHTATDGRIVDCAVTPTDSRCAEFA